MRDIGILRVS